MLPPPVQQFRAPQYSGQGDIEYFISHFKELTDANEWGPGAALLNLRDSLKESVKNCDPGSQCAGGLRGIEGLVWTVTQGGKVTPQ